MTYCIISSTRFGLVRRFGLVVRNTLLDIGDVYLSSHYGHLGVRYHRSSDIFPIFYLSPTGAGTMISSVEEYLVFV